MRWIKSILILLVFFNFSCDDKFKTFDSKILPANRIKISGSDTIIKDSTENFYFSRLSKQGVGGLGTTFTISPEHKNKDLYVVVSGRVRTHYVFTNSTITISAINQKNEVISWQGIFLRYYYTECDKWCHFSDSIFLPGKDYKLVNAFTFLGAPDESFDIDTLKVDIKEKI